VPEGLLDNDSPKFVRRASQKPSLAKPFGDDRKECRLEREIEETPRLDSARKLVESVAEPGHRLDFTRVRRVVEDSFCHLRKRRA
jgi:hypothetical protein